MRSAVQKNQHIFIFHLLFLVGYLQNQPKFKKKKKKCTFCIFRVSGEWEKCESVCVRERNNEEQEDRTQQNGVNGRERDGKVAVGWWGRCNFKQLSRKGRKMGGGEEDSKRREELPCPYCGKMEPKVAWPSKLNFGVLCGVVSGMGIAYDPEISWYLRV